MAIAGLGLLGGSLGLCLRASGSGLTVHGYARRRETVESALQMGAIDHGSTNPADVLPQADLTVVCMPVIATADFLVENASLWRRDTVVTDVGSIKGRIIAEAREPLRRSGVQFIGSHPMAGSEKAGLTHAVAALYVNAVVFVTPLEGDHPVAIDRVFELWRRVGGRPHAIAVAAHDALVARTSHILHLLAAAAVPVGLAHPDAAMATAGGFRDLTRIAESSPEMWRQIFELNREHVLTALAEFDAELDGLRHCVADGDWAELQRRLTEARDKRADWFEKWQQLRTAQH